MTNCKNWDEEIFTCKPLKASDFSDCKKCKYTDEYRASGDCNKIQANNLACNKTSLTEQMHKGELKLGEHYYYTTIFSPTVHIQNFTRDVINFQDFKETVAEVLAPVPSFEQWQAKLEENAQLKKLLKRCRDELFEVYSNEISHPEGVPIIKKLNKVLK